MNKRRRGLVAVIGLLSQDLPEHLSPFLRDEAAHLQVGWLDGVDVNELVEDRGDVVTWERLLAGEHLERAHSEGEDIAATVQFLSHRLLGRHVRGGAQQHARLRHLRIRELGDAEVRDLDVVPFGQDQVRGLDVAVDDTLGVRIIDCRSDLAHEADDPLGVEPHALLDQCRDRLARHELHRQERQAAFLADIEQRDDVRMAEGA